MICLIKSFNFLKTFQCSNPEEKIYADWDCPQAITVHDYKAGQEDELCLTKGDLVNILRKMPDGIFQFCIYRFRYLVD